MADVLVTLGVVGAMLVLLASLPPRIVGRSRESANKVKCASNLRQIGQSMRQYALDNGGDFPADPLRPE